MTSKAKLTAKNQASIPKEIREILGLNRGDSIGFEVTPDKEVRLFRLEPLDVDYLASLDKSLSEWNSEEDNKNFKHLQEI
jgi:AbrB family looped-hinge helix DNA binding protein